MPIRLMAVFGVNLLEVCSAYSCVLEDGSFDYPVRFLPTFDEAMDVLHCLRCEALLSGLSANACGYMLDNVKLPEIIRPTKETPS